MRTELSKRIVKQATIIEVNRFGLKVVVEDKAAFIKRRDIDWANPAYDVMSSYFTGQKIEVMELRGRSRKDSIYSIKHLSSDPFKDFIEIYDSHKTFIVEGTVREILTEITFLVLQDYNTGVIIKNDFKYLSNYKQKALSDIFAVGDHVRGVVRDIDILRENLLVSISSYMHYTYSNKKVKKSDNTKLEEIWGDSLESYKRYLGIIEKKEITADNFDKSFDLDAHNILCIENEESQIEIFKRICNNLGIHNSCFFFSEEKAQDLDVKLKDITNYTAIFVDNQLGGNNINSKYRFAGIKYIIKILEIRPDCPVIFVSGHDKEKSKKMLKTANLHNKVYYMLKPYRTEDIVDALSWSAKALDERYAEIIAHQYKETALNPEKNFLTEEAHIMDLLNNLVKSSFVSVAILRMNTITLEVDSLFFTGSSEIDWAKYKSKLISSPVIDVLQHKKPCVFFDSIKKGVLRNFPNELRNIRSFIGIPLKDFGEANFGVFIFDSSGAIKESDFLQLLNNTEKISLLLERYLFKIKMRDGLKIQTMGVLYSSMRHELVSIIGDISAYNLVDQWDRFKKVSSKSRTNEESQKTIFRKKLMIVQDRTRDLRKLLKFYSSLEESGETIERVSLIELINRVIKKLEKSDDAAYIDLNFNNFSDKSEIIINVSRTRLSQIIRNVLLNACQQIDQSELPHRFVTVELHYKAEEDDRLPIKISVKDSGPGIHRKNFESIFDLFNTTREGGTGLGLNICRQFLKEIGGKISVKESYMLTGSEFLIELRER